MHIPTLEPANAPDDVQQLYSDFQRRMGFPSAPNFIKTQGHSPAVVQGTWGLVKNVLVGGLLPRTLKEMMFSAISKDRACRYCEAAHLACCRMLGVDSRTLEMLVAARVLTARPRRVLVVDDNMDAASAMSDLLERAGHEVVVLHDGVGTLAELERIRPEVALLDIGLPGMDGYELAREIRSRLGYATPYLIALTGYGRPEDRQRSQAAGFDVHFVKPVGGAKLLQAIEAAPIAA